MEILKKYNLIGRNVGRTPKDDYTELIELIDSHFTDLGKRSVDRMKKLIKNLLPFNIKY